MPRSCSAEFCQNRKKPGCRKTFHRFPFSQPEVLKRWLVNMKIDKWKPNKESLLCSDHFDEQAFDRTGQTVRIRAGAVPTVFNFPTHLQKNIKTGEPPLERQTVETETEKLPVVQENESVRQDNVTVCQENVTVRQENVTVRQENVTVRQENVTALQENVTVLQAKENVVVRLEHSYCESPTTLKRKLENVTAENNLMKKRLKTYQQKVRRLKKKLNSMSEMMQVLC